MAAGNPINYNPGLPLTYVGVQLTVTTTAKSLLSLIQALGGIYAACAAQWSEVTIQNEPLIPSAQAIRIGDSTITTTTGLVVSIGNSRTYPNGVDISRVYLIAASATGTTLVNVECSTGGSQRW
jgi:hypothetical protein